MFCPDAGLFFQSPSQSPHLPGNFGILYLLRRDILQCLGRNPCTGGRLGSQALWPAAMAILAGIDLLAKYLDGSDATGDVGKRYCAFVSKYFQPLSAGEEQTLYQLRNALLHSFGLYSENHGTQYRFTLSFQPCCIPASLVTNLGGGRYFVEVANLHGRFEAAVSAFQKDVDANTALQQNFRKMFVKYGSIPIS